jgi:hypothetical protein
MKCITSVTVDEVMGKVKEMLPPTLTLVTV